MNLTKFQYIELVDKLLMEYWNVKTNAPFLLPVAMKISAKILGFDLVSVQPIKNPL